MERRVVSPPMGCPVGCSSIAALRCLVKMNASVIEPGLRGANI